MEIKVGDRVRTVKGANFCGVVLAVYPKLDGTPHCTVEATDPQFRGTTHVYPLVQVGKFDE